MLNFSRSEDEAGATAKAMAGLGSEGVPMRADVSDDAQVRALMAAIGERFGRLDVLVNNAGTTAFIPYPDLDAVTDEVWDRLLGVNVKGAFNCSRAAAGRLREARGAIVNVSSIAGLRAIGSSIPYGVSKAALTHLTRSLAMVLAPEVRVNAVVPGIVATRWFRRGFGEEAAMAQEEAAAGTTPLAGVATADHVAQAVMGLIGADFVTGETLIVDGGRHLAY